MFASLKLYNPPSVFLFGWIQKWTVLEFRVWIQTHGRSSCNSEIRNIKKTSVRLWNFRAVTSWWFGEAISAPPPSTPEFENLTKTLDFLQWRIVFHENHRILWIEKVNRKNAWLTKIGHFLNFKFEKSHCVTFEMVSLENQCLQI